MQSATEWRQITAAELRAFMIEVSLLAVIGCGAIVYTLRHALKVPPPYALSVAFFCAAMAQLPALTVGTREKGKPMPVRRYVIASALGSVLFIPAWFLWIA